MANCDLSSVAISSKMKICTLELLYEKLRVGLMRISTNLEESLATKKLFPFSSHRSRIILFEGLSSNSVGKRFFVL